MRRAGATARRASRPAPGDAAAAERRDCRGLPSRARRAAAARCAAPPPSAPAAGARWPRPLRQPRQRWPGGGRWRARTAPPRRHDDPLAVWGRAPGARRGASRHPGGRQVAAGAGGWLCRRPYSSRSPVDAAAPHAAARAAAGPRHAAHGPPTRRRRLEGQLARAHRTLLAERGHAGVDAGTPPPLPPPPPARSSVLVLPPPLLPRPDALAACRGDAPPPTSAGPGPSLFFHP